VPPEVHVSIVIPTYKRPELVFGAIDSSIKSMRDQSFEIIVIDDCSNDGTAEILRANLSKQTENGFVRLFVLPKNVGVTGAKNFGARQARGKYIVFLDSDDELIPDHASLFFESLMCADQENVDLLFFRCLDFDSNELIGPKQNSIRAANLEMFLDKRHYPGECLTVVERVAFLKYPYNEELRGFEGLSNCRLLAAGHRGNVYPIAFRKYRRGADDQLTSRKSRIRNADRLADGFALQLREFGQYMPITDRIKSVIRIVAYRVISLFASVGALR
jgi:glycosyltransferase involved in cell wall biosynthesis